MTDDALSTADLSTARSALLFVRRAIAARREPTAALDRALAGIETAMATAANGGPKTPLRDDWGEAWATTSEAAQALECSERRMREIARSIGGVKRGGCWWIPRSALPEEEIND